MRYMSLSSYRQAKISFCFSPDTTWQMIDLIYFILSWKDDLSSEVLPNMKTWLLCVLGKRGPLLDVFSGFISACISINIISIQLASSVKERIIFLIKRLIWFIRFFYLFMSLAFMRSVFLLVSVSQSKILIQPKQRYSVNRKWRNITGLIKNFISFYSIKSYKMEG